MFEKLYLVGKSELDKIEKVPALSYKEIYEAVIASKNQREGSRVILSVWLRFKW
jgi:hypothetical protein